MRRRKSIIDHINEAVVKSTWLFDKVDRARKDRLSKITISYEAMQQLPEMVSDKSLTGFYVAYLNKKYKKHSKSICKRAFEVRHMTYGLVFILRKDSGRGWYNNGIDSRKESIQA